MVRKSKIEAKSLINGKVFSLFFTVLVMQFLISILISLFASIPLFINKGFASINIMGNPAGFDAFLEAVSTDPSLTILILLFSTVASLLAYPLAIGQTLYFLNVGQERKEKATDFIRPYARTIKIAIVMIGFTFLVTIGMMLLIIPGIYFALKYALLPQVLADRPELSIKETFAEAARLSKGNKGKIFWLPLSFFFWIPLIIITFGLAVIYLMPYYETAGARLYLNIKEEMSAKPAELPQNATSGMYSSYLEG